MINNLEHVNRFRSTMVAASAKQLYFGNYLFNRDNDFELTALIDPYSETYGSNTVGLNSINATNNYWSTSVDSEIRARIRDKYDNVTLFEVIYSPEAADEYSLREGKCEAGWTLIDDVCYLFVGSYSTYREAESTCKSLQSKLARETVAPIRAPSFRTLARNSQFNYESQTYRKLWLHTDNILSGSCTIMDDYASITILSADCSKQLYPFICEKDPVYLGAKFRFRDEIAFAVGSVGVLLICIVALSLLWVYKSRKRKKEHLARQDTLRRSARANRNLLNYTASSGVTKSTTTLHRDENSVSKNDVNSTIKSNKGGKQQQQKQKIYTDDENSVEYNSTGDFNNGRRRIMTNGSNRFKRQQTKVDDSENDYHIYDTNGEDTETDASIIKKSRLNESPTNGSIKTQETFYTDTLVRMNEKQRIETTLANRNQPITSTLRSNNNNYTPQQQQQQQQQQPTPSILKKTNIFGSSTYDHLVNEEFNKTPTTANTSQRTSAYFPPSDDLNDYTQFDNVKSKSNRNLSNISTFITKPFNANISDKIPYTGYNNNNSGNSSLNYDNLGSGSSSAGSPKRPTMPPPPRPAPAPPRKLVNESDEPILINNNLIKSPSKYLLAAEAELNAEREYEQNKNQIREYNEQIQQQILPPNTNPSYTIKKPQILSEINKSPHLQHQNFSSRSTTANKSTNETDVQHNSKSTTDISKPPPMETSI